MRAGMARQGACLKVCASGGAGESGRLWDEFRVRRAGAQAARMLRSSAETQKERLTDALVVETARADLELTMHGEEANARTEALLKELDAACESARAAFKQLLLDDGEHENPSAAAWQEM